MNPSDICFAQKQARQTAHAAASSLEGALSLEPSTFTTPGRSTTSNIRSTYVLRTMHTLGQLQVCHNHMILVEDQNASNANVTVYYWYCSTPE